MKKYDLTDSGRGFLPSIKEVSEGKFYLCSEADEVISGLRTSLGKSVKDVLSFMHQLDEKDAVIAELRGEVERLMQYASELSDKISALVDKGTPKPDGPSHPTSAVKERTWYIDAAGNTIGYDRRLTLEEHLAIVKVYQEKYALLGPHSDPPETADQTK